MAILNQNSRKHKPGFVIHAADVQKDMKLSLIDERILSVIRSHATIHAEGCCSVGRSYLAARAKCKSLRTVAKSLAKLRALGYVDWGRTGRSSIYTIRERQDGGHELPFSEASNAHLMGTKCPSQPEKSGGNRFKQPDLPADDGGRKDTFLRHSQKNSSSDSPTGLEAARSSNAATTTHGDGNKSKAKATTQSVATCDSLNRHQNQDQELLHAQIALTRNRGNGSVPDLVITGQIRHQFESRKEFQEWLDTVKPNRATSRGWGMWREDAKQYLADHVEQKRQAAEKQVKRQADAERARAARDRHMAGCDGWTVEVERERKRIFLDQCRVVWGYADGELIECTKADKSVARHEKLAELLAADPEFRDWPQFTDSEFERAREHHRRAQEFHAREAARPEARVN